MQNRNNVNKNIVKTIKIDKRKRKKSLKKAKHFTKGKNLFLPRNKIINYFDVSVKKIIL